jgi:hypothetical protein
MSEQQLVTINPAGTALATTVSEGLEGFTLKPAILKLVQNTTTDEGAVKGKLFDTLSKANFDKLQVVPLSIKMTRVLFPPNGDLGAEPLCRSNDGIVPSPDAQVPQCASCANCDSGPKAWKNFRSTGKKPDCQEKFRMLFIDRDSGLPYFVTIGGKSITQLKKLKDAIYRDVLSCKMKQEFRSIYDYTFELVPLLVTGKRGNYYELTFCNLKKIANPGEFGPMYEMFVKNYAAAHPADPAADAIDSEFSTEQEQAPTQYENV